MDMFHAFPESYTLSPDLCVFNEANEDIGYINFLGDESFMQYFSE